MPRLQTQSVETVSSTAQMLRDSSDTLAEVARKMSQHELSEAYFPWTQRQWDCLDIVNKLASDCRRAIAEQAGQSIQQH